MVVFRGFGKQLMTMARWNNILQGVFAACGRARGDAAQWCQGRSWKIRAPVWLMLAYFGILQAINPHAWTLFSGINLPIHEGGHLLFRLLGWEFLHTAGGTLLQTVVPLASALMFAKQRDYFAIAFCFGWLSTNLMATRVYMADAEAMQLPLVTAEGGDGSIGHDWQYLFSQFGLLRYCEAIGWLTRQAANLVMLAALGLGGWLMARMASAPKDASRGDRRSALPRVDGLIDDAPEAVLGGDTDQLANLAAVAGIGLPESRFRPRQPPPKPTLLKNTTGRPALSVIRSAQSAQRCLG